MESESDNGWLHVVVVTDESIKGFAVTYNGRDIPIYVDKPATGDLS